jgi:hypothetical protein
MSDFQDMHESLFDAFAEPATVQRGAEPAVPVDVVIDEGRQILGEFGQVVAQVRVASFRVAQFRPAANDVLTIGVTSRAVERILSDDGFVAEAVLYG